MKYYVRYLKKKATGGVFDTIVTDTLQNLEVLLPSISTQRKIAAFLSAYDYLVENNTRRIKILEEMAQRIYKEWFVHFRYPGYENVKMVYNKELDKDIPEVWKVKKLLDISDVTYGFPFKSKEFSTELNLNYSKVIRIRDIIPSVTNTSSPETSADKYIVNDGDILVGMDGEFHIGKWTGGVAYLNQRVARFKPKEKISRYFLYHSIKTPIKELNQSIVGTTVAHLSARDINAIEIVLPNDVIIGKSNEIFNSIFDQELNLRKQIMNLRQTRDLLLPKLISGKINVEQLNIEL